MYVDGNLEAAGAGNTNALVLPTRLRFGSLQSGVGSFNGVLYDIRIYSRALGSTEVTALYGDSAFAAMPPTNLTATAGNDQVVLAWPEVPHVMTFRRIERTGEVDLYVDGTFMGRTAGSTASLQAPAQLVLGAQQTLTYYLSGDIAEVKVFNTPLSDADRSHEETSLEYKSGILPKPATALTRSGPNSLAASWPGWADGWELYLTTNLAAPAVWLLVTNAFASNNGQFNVTVPVDSGTRLFLLTAP